MQCSVTYNVEPFQGLHYRGQSLGTGTWEYQLGMIREWLSKRKYTKLVQELGALPPDQRSQKIKALTHSEKAACLESVSLNSQNRDVWFELTKANSQECAVLLDKLLEPMQAQKAINDVLYAKGVCILHEKLKVTGWRVQIWGAEQGCAIAPSGVVFTWISPNLSDVPWDWDHREIRWHPKCIPPQAVTDWILYTLPEEGHKICLAESDLPVLKANPPEAS